MVQYIYKEPIDNSQNKNTHLITFLIIKLIVNLCNLKNSNFDDQWVFFSDGIIIKKSDLIRKKASSAIGTGTPIIIKDPIHTDFIILTFLLGFEINMSKWENL